MVHNRQASGLITQQEEDEERRNRFGGIAAKAARTVVVTGLAVGVGLGVASAANAAEPVPAAYAYQCTGGDMGPGSCQVDEIGADIVNGIASNGTACVKGAIGTGILSGIIKKIAGPPELGIGCAVNVIKKNTGFDGWGIF
ncbi:hypothetical protein [uncultured Pseudonocardia sp.]|uniref:hypothetical protein n=1 Tax=uncultured Pseudonocardia sp. TaxID=211455 RepID=UPI0026145F12|nr:hypothetical protein [uncultured Pseudonocardia sp.]